MTAEYIDNIITDLNGTDIAFSDSSGSRFCMSYLTNYGEKIGAFSIHNSTEIITNATNLAEKYSEILAAALLRPQSRNFVHRINMVILNDSTSYDKIDTSDNKQIASPIIALGLHKNVSNQTVYVDLLFRDDNYDRRAAGEYSCSYLDTNLSKWSADGSIKPVYDTTNKLFNCTYNHTTTFALIWLPSIFLSKSFNAQDITSLVFLSISILCFIGVIIHSLVNRLKKSFASLLARDLLPLISTASTTILFIFYIALTMTVYTQTPEEIITKCFTSASVLMFFTYFFLIFMFCAKTSVGYFNYLRFVHLFPEPSFRKLYILLIISFIISLIWTLFAIGFHSDISFNIIQIHGNKICWFTRDVIHYFMTIPVSIFLFLNFISICLIGKRIIQHACNATSPHGTHQRMKRCVLVILSSCVTQGLAWLLGPLITVTDPKTADIIGWFFVIFNGLEGLWTVLLYLIIRTQRVYEVKRTATGKMSYSDLFYGTTFDMTTTSTEL